MNQFSNTTENLQKLIDIGIALSKEKNINKLLEKILIEARKISNSDGGTLYLMSDDDTRLSYNKSKFTLCIFTNSLDNDKLILISRNFNQSAYISLLQIKKRNAEKLRQQVSEFIGAYIKIYDPIIKNNFSLNNAYIKGSAILEGDFQACKRFSPKTNNFHRQNGFQVLK